ncbi:MAG: protein translocase subunit SecD [Brachybacterium sp.]|nr:protein translocase subunit SecD [Brachybacterium sp.]
MPARRIALATLAVLMLLLGGGVTAGVQAGGWGLGPKLALDLEGGTQVILQAQTRDGSEIDADAMEQARQIMSQRINAMGVAETEISVQGGTNIVVDVPGEMDQATSDALRRTAALSFRPVLDAAGPEGQSDAGGATDGVQGDGSTSGEPADDEDAAEPVDPSDAGGSEDATAGAADGPDAWSEEWATPEARAAFDQADCTDPTALREEADDTPPSDPMVVCAPDGSAKYLLGPEVASGAGIRDASVGQDQTPTGQPTGAYVVNMTFQEESAQDFAAMTQALVAGENPTRTFAIVLDGQAISAPYVEGASADGRATISGDFSQDEAQQLADQVRFGALPLEFTVQSEQQISATLGADQLRNGMLAGLIGLALVVAYTILQYRVLSIVTTASLLIMGGMVFSIITILSHIPEIGYRLSLAGVAGLIVAIGFTADSFIVYFERVRDEIRDGRGIVSAVDHGWRRARRTVVISDLVNLIAAVVLYLLSTGNVRGFAFTLGLTTLLDLVIVFLFTHPMLQTLVRTRFFGKGHPLSGLDPTALGRNLPAYAGRGRLRDSDERRARDARGRRDGTGDTPVETLAQRKARQAREAEQQSPGKEPS